MSSQNSINIVDSEDSVRTPAYYPDTPPHSHTNSENSADSFETMWEAINRIPNSISDSSDSESEEEEPTEEEEESMEEKPESIASVNQSLKRKEPESPAADVAGPSKRASAPFSSSYEQMLVKCDLLNLKKSTEKCRKEIKHHVARIETRQNKLEKENKAIADARNFQMDRMEEVVRFEVERERKRTNLIIKDIHYHQDRLKSQLDKCYDHLQYFCQKQEARYAEFKRFEEYVEASLWNLKKGPGPM